MGTNAKKTKPTAIYMSADRGQGSVKHVRLRTDSDLTYSENRDACEIHWKLETRFKKKRITTPNKSWSCFSTCNLCMWVLEICTSSAMERTSVPRGKRPRVQVSADDKERAIARIRKGETKAGISRELGVPESTVRGWVKRADQRLAREACDGKSHLISSSVRYSMLISMAANGSESPPSLAMQSLKLPVKRDHSGQQMPPPMTPMSAMAPIAMIPANPTMPTMPTVPTTPTLPTISTIPTIPTTPVAVPMPMQLFQQAADSQLQLNGWLHIFNAGILNFTLIATAAFLRARMRGTTDRQSLWQIICDYVDEAGRNVNANGGSMWCQRRGWDWEWEWGSTGNCTTHPLRRATMDLWRHGCTSPPRMTRKSRRSRRAMKTNRCNSFVCI